MIVSSRSYQCSWPAPSVSLSERAEALEQFLGDPLESFKRAVELDERDEYPAETCGVLDQWGLNDYYVPIELGGRLESFEEFLSLVRVVARRDMTAAVAHVKTYLGAVSVWMGGSDEQKRRLAKIDRDRQGRVERKKERHLNQQRQTAAERIRFLHQTQLLHL